MYCAGSSTTHTHASSKVRGCSHTTSPPWSEGNVELSPLLAGHWQYNPQTPSAPSLSSVPLPSPGGSSSISSSYHGLTPPGRPFTNSPSIHPILVYDPTGRLLFNVTFPVTHIRLRPSFAHSVMNDQATSPPTSRVNINVFGFPRWEAEIIKPAGVTVGDVLNSVHGLLFDRLVGRDEFIAYSQRRQDAASRAFNARTARDPFQRSQGIKRADFLNNAVFFVGLSRSTDIGSDCWHINMSAQIS